MIRSRLQDLVRKYSKPRLVAAALAVGLAASALFYGYASQRALPSLPVAVVPAQETPVAAASALPAVEFHRDIKPIFENRCAVCHGCYDAPCQLKLDSAEGVMRGATKAMVYDSTRLVDAPLTRLFTDAQTTEEWRQKDFFSVVYEGEPPVDALARLDGSLLLRMLELKREHPMPVLGPNKSARDYFDLGIDRKEQCPTLNQFDKYAREHPHWGMPYALPAISDDEFNSVKHWLEAGSPIAERPPLPRAVVDQVSQWEKLLNGDALKTQLMARYVYEHLFIGDLYFSDLTSAGNPVFFKLVRSRTAPGQPIDVIATRRPYDDPGVARVYYRLQPVRGAILAKTHLPYALNEKRKQRYRELFLDADYRVEALPTYGPEVAANPFIAFHDLPERSRYQFLLDDAGFIIGNFIKGPVCRGQIALNVIDDRFWVLFADPDAVDRVDSDFLARESKNLQLPALSAEQKNSPLRQLLALSDWNRYARLQGDYLAAKSKYLRARTGRPDALTLHQLWNGDGPVFDESVADEEGASEKNPNAALTIFRHYDSASVVEGLVGATPKTAWVLDYPLLERLHYLLVAGFDVYGDASHQLLTRLYMDFLRMEAEYNYLNFLPQKMRDSERNSWYQGVGAKFRDSVYRQVPAYRVESGVLYKTKDYKTEFFAQMRERLGASLNQHLDLQHADIKAGERAELQKLTSLRGAAVANLPEVVFLRVVVKDAPDHAFTLLHNAAYANVAVLLLDRERRRPQLDTLTVVPGFVGAYPNAFWRVTEAELPAFIRQFSRVRSKQDFHALEQRYRIARDNEKFWSYSDWMHRAYRERDPIGWGLFDYNRYE